jgi:hypothetical protein
MNTYLVDNSLRLIKLLNCKISLGARPSNRRKMEDQRRQVAEKEAASRRANSSPLGLPPLTGLD